MIKKLSSKLAIYSSFLCLIHCLVLPVLVSIAPMGFLGITGNWELVEFGFFVSIILFSLYSFFTHYFKIHGKKHPLLYLGMYAILFFLSHTLFHEYESILAFVSTICIVLHYFVNKLLCNSCKGCC